MFISFVIENSGSIITALIIAAAVLAAVIKILRGRKKGGCGCGCDTCDRKDSCCK